MDVRDYFAGQALSSLMKDGHDYKKQKDMQKLAHLAYELADALLEARERPSLPSSLPEIVASTGISHNQDGKDTKINKGKKSPPSVDTAPT